jgi:hypothetical protein
MVRSAWVALLLLGLAGCGSGMSANGTCRADSECQLCTVCGCARTYARADTGSASCAEISAGEMCTKGKSDDCLSGPMQALCVSGHCAAITRLAP